MPNENTCPERDARTPIVGFVRWKAVLVRWCCVLLGCVRVVWLVILNYPHPRPLKEVCQSESRASP